MSELFQTAVTGLNIVPTILLGLVLLYWITVILGALDIDFLDFDADGPDDVPDVFQGLLAFINVANLPFMVVFSVLILFFWILVMLMYYLPFPPGGWVNAILYIPALMLSMFLTKMVITPFKGLMDITNTGRQKENENLIGILCTLQNDLPPERLGQAEVETGGASLRINVKAQGSEALKKGEIAYIVGRDPKQEFYFVSRTAKASEGKLSVQADKASS
ncbi:MAG: hypothetical protein GX115_04220 [Ruminiclostridium sp.]|nr:hypothetical protein [Ruminiclostridium sp.]